MQYYKKYDGFPNPVNHIIRTREEEKERRRARLSEQATHERISKLENWIDSNLSQARTFNLKQNSISLKKIFNSTNDYSIRVTNSEFKQAMKKMGYRAKNEAEDVWIFNVSQKSKAIENFNVNSQ